MSPFKRLLEATEGLKSVKSNIHTLKTYFSLSHFYELLIFIFCACTNAYKYVRMCTISMLSPYGVQKRVLDLLELKSQAEGSCEPPYVDAGNQHKPRVVCLNIESSSQPLFPAHYLKSLILGPFLFDSSRW